MKIYFKKHQKLRRAFYFFPLQLMLMTVKKNFYYIIIWLIFFGFITHSIGAKYGVPYLFLYPEYLNQVNFFSYLLLGFSCGGLIMAFNISSYVINSFRFPFLATLERPFFVYFLNNLPIPIAFIFTYILAVFHFRINDNVPTSTIAWHLTGFLIGVVNFMIITILYFYLFDRNIFGLFGVSPLKASKVKIKPIKKKDPEIDVLWHDPHLPLSYSDRSWFVETYLSADMHLRLSRGIKHYHKKMLEAIFRHNHQTGSVFEIIAIASLLIMGIFRQNPVFMVPAGASIMLLLTIFIMLISALHTWFRGWTTTVVILLFFGVDYFSRTHWSYFSAKAYGMNYSVPAAEYSYDAFDKMLKDTAILRKDKNDIQGILERWRKRNTDTLNNNKPDFIIVNTSGGGLRSTLWSFYTLQYLDSLSNGSFFKHAELMTGSSGGVIGAAYYRELYLEKLQGKNIDPNNRMYFDKIGQDILNPIVFTIATNDMAFRFQHFKDGNNTYTKDRAYAFEEKLNANTDSVMAKRLGDYQLPEYQAKIPMLFITPSIVNDGRKMIISPQRISFMTGYDVDTTFSYKPIPQSIEFSRVFKDQGAQNLFFTSALRMNSTFPFISPLTELPSNPPIEAMDAGLIDNFGLEEAVKFVYTYRNWLPSHTRRILIIQIRDQVKKQRIWGNSPTDILGSITFPITQFYTALFPVENFKEDRMVEYMSAWYKGRIDVVYFQLNNEGNDDVSLSWRLTDREKYIILNSMKTAENQDALAQLKKLMR
ncbi:MAG TPA: patatin-like phospholipase family protein [Bacteroidia bacterium]|nr:patatin-like phospholipase family protein [Bacteroidia bacterium]